MTTPPEFLRVLLCPTCKGDGYLYDVDRTQDAACVLCMGKRAVTIDVRDLVQLRPWAPEVSAKTKGRKK